MPKKKAKKKIDKVETYISQQKGPFLVWEKNLTKMTTTYYFRGRQADSIDSIQFKGFLGVPGGFFLTKEGWGFLASTKGSLFLGTLKDAIPQGKKVELIITRRGNQSYREHQHKVVITLPADDFKNLIQKLKLENKKHSDEIRDMSNAYLSSRFPNKIRLSTEEFDSYKSGEVADVLHRKGISSRLNEEDLEAIFDFFPKVFESSLQGRKKVLKDLKIRLAKEGKRITDKIFLDEVIREFEQKIEKKAATEKEWHIFLRDKVFPFLTNYVQVIDRENIGVDEKYPDFVLKDLYGFADVFEIKTHVATLLTYDPSHDNYYWSSDITKAIAQVEGYIDEIGKSESEYVKKIRRKYKFDLTINRPKGFVVAGTYTQLKDEKQLEDFRRLRRSHKNVEFVVYDELLENMKALQAKLEHKNPKQKRHRKSRGRAGRRG